MDFSDLIIEHIERTAGKARSQLESALEIKGLRVRFGSDKGHKLFAKYLGKLGIAAVNDSGSRIEVEIPLRRINPGSPVSANATFYIEGDDCKRFIEAYGEKFGIGSPE